MISRIYIEKKRLLAYFAVLILSIIFASFYGGPVSFVWLYFILLLLPVSVIYIVLNYRFLSLYQEIEVHRVSKGENHNYRVMVENGGILPIHGMTLGLYKDRCDLPEVKEGEPLSLDIHEKREMTSSISCKYAGAYNVGIEHLFFHDPFRLFSVRVDVPYSFRAVVSPRITDVAEEFLDIENMVNSTGLKSAKLYEETPGNDFRAYQKGDSLTSVNWKLSARFSELMARVPDRMEKTTVTLILEASNTPESEQDIEFLKNRDYFLEFIVSAAWHFGEQGVPVKLIYPAGEIRESVVDSYDTFLEFYNIVADGIFYRSEEEHKRLENMIDVGRNAQGDGDTWILIREEHGPGEDICSIIG